MPCSSFKGSWRQELFKRRDYYGIEWLNPEDIPYKHSGDEPFVVEEDLKLISACDVVLACFNEEGQYGTIIEALVGLYEFHKKLIVFISDSNYWFFENFLNLLQTPNVIFIGNDMENVSIAVISLRWDTHNSKRYSDWTVYFDKDYYINQLCFQTNSLKYQLEERGKQLTNLNEDIKMLESKLYKKKSIEERIHKTKY